MSLRAAAIRLPRSTMRVSGMSKRSIGGTSTPPHNKNSKDIPWIVGGIAVLVPTAYYFVSRSSLKHGDNISNDAKAIPVAEKVGLSGQPGGPQSPAGGPSKQEMDATLAREMRADAPKSAYYAEEEATKKRQQPAGGPSDNDLQATIERELRADAPKTAYYAEEEAAKKRQQPAGGPSGDEVQESIQRGLRADAPKTARQAEEESARKKQRV